MSEVRARLLYSSRTLKDVIYRAELDGEEVVHTLTRVSTPSISVVNCGSAFSLASHLRQSYSVVQ